MCVVGQGKQTKCHLPRALMAAANQQQAFTRTPRISIYGVCGCRGLLVEAVESIDDQCESAVVQTRGPKQAALTKTLPTHAIESRKAHFPSTLHKARKSVCEALLCVWLPKALSESKAAVCRRRLPAAAPPPLETKRYLGLYLGAYTTFSSTGLLRWVLKPWQATLGLTGSRRETMRGLVEIPSPESNRCIG